MLVQKLDADDLNFSHMGAAYDGTLAYAQNKRQQAGATLAAPPSPLPGHAARPRPMSC